MGLDEKWLPILGYENRYEVCNLGMVRSVRAGQVLRGDPTKDGYIRVKLWDRERYKSRMIHCLVVEAFISRPDLNNQYEVDHIDNDVANNAVTNLRWLTHKENLDKSFALNHQTKPKKAVYQFDLDGRLLHQYESVNEAFRQTQIRHISECATGKRKTAGGYKWSCHSTMKEG